MPSNSNSTVSGVGSNSHNPNPFYFVPFVKERPFTCDESQWNEQPRYSGRLTISLKTLTPLHIVGQQEGNGKEIKKSYFYRQDGVPCIPGSSIRGMLRAFVEALTNGWVSQANDYPKKYQERHIGFGAFSESRYIYETGLKKGQTWRNPDPAIDPKFCPGSGNDNKLDVASWLFGIVAELEGKEHLSAGGYVRVEDAFPEEAGLKRYVLPDINGNAFMGGGKPSASSWWYFLSEDVRQRNVKGRDFAEFIGKKLRGRKFYFHQDSVRCVGWYEKYWANLNVVIRRGEESRPPLYLYPAECMNNGNVCSFHIFVDDLPISLLYLLLLCIEPGQVIRHKLGYGKPYGFGSIEMELIEVKLRKENPGRWPIPDLEDRSDLHNKAVLPPGNGASVWDNGHLRDLGLDEMVHKLSLQALARILGWEPKADILFTYPPFSRGNFNGAIDWKSVKGKAEERRIMVAKLPVPLANSLILAEALWGESSGNKRTIDLAVYQKKATGWSAIIEKRKP